MTREEAITIVLAEAFAETGLGSLAENGGDPGYARMEALKDALGFLVADLADENVFDRQFVSALFVLSNRVPEFVKRRNPNSPRYRASFVQQVDELIIYVSDLIENWNHWPDWESNPLRTHRFGPD